MSNIWMSFSFYRKRDLCRRVAVLYRVLVYVLKKDNNKKYNGSCFINE